jgi:pyruvate carboxylase
MGLLARWTDVKEAFALVNVLVGDIPKVTPSSKMVGDFAVFLLKNELVVRRGTLEESAKATEAKLIETAPRLDFPSGVVGYFRGELGQPPGGFPEALRRAVLKGLPIVTGRPSASMPPLDLGALRNTLVAKFEKEVTRHDALSAALYPRVMDEFLAARQRFEDVSILDTPTYFYGMELGQEHTIELEPGKTLVVSLSAIGDVDDEGKRTVYFSLNGHARQVTVLDKARAPAVKDRRAADKSNPAHVGTTMPGTIVVLHKKVGDAIAAGEPLMTIEAMKMETVVRAQRAGTLKELVVDTKSIVQPGDLLAVLE